MFIYIDDAVFTGSNEAMISELIEDMMKHYEMTNLGFLHYFLGIGVIPESSSIFIHQQKYAQTLLEKFGRK